VPHVRTSVRGLIKTGRSPIKGLSFPCDPLVFRAHQLITPNGTALYQGTTLVVP
jgi:hypothetical protein